MRDKAGLLVDVMFVLAMLCGAASAALCAIGDFRAQVCFACLGCLLMLAAVFLLLYSRGGGE